MNPIAFSTPMARAISEGGKTQTRRVMQKPPALDAWGHPRDACPFGQVGERLWVQEPVFVYGRWDAGRFVDGQRGYRFPGQLAALAMGDMRHPGTPGWWRLPAMHMPRAASRLTLEIRGVWAERLRDISEANAQAEGVWHHPYHARHHHDRRGSAVSAFFALWESHNGPESWARNPWVWVLDFRRV